MGKKIIDLSDEEDKAFNAKLLGRTHREAVLDAMNIPYEKRRVGRPSLDEIKAKMETSRQKLLAADYKRYIDSMPTQAEVDEKRKKLQDVFKESQARRLSR